MIENSSRKNTASQILGPTLMRRVDDKLHELPQVTKELSSVRITDGFEAEAVIVLVVSFSSIALRLLTDIRNSVLLLKFGQRKNT